MSRLGAIGMDISAPNGGDYKDGTIKINNEIMEKIFEVTNHVGQFKKLSQNPSFDVNCTIQLISRPQH